MELDEKKGAARLAVAIIEQAVIDYIDDKKDKYGNNQRNDCIKFFRSHWCETLLAMAGVEWDSEYLIRMVKEKAEKEENKKRRQKTWVV